MTVSRTAYEIAFNTSHHRTHHLISLASTNPTIPDRPSAVVQHSSAPVCWSARVHRPPAVERSGALHSTGAAALHAFGCRAITYSIHAASARHLAPPRPESHYLSDPRRIGRPHRASGDRGDRPRADTRRTRVRSTAPRGHRAPHTESVGERRLADEG